MKILPKKFEIPVDVRESLLYIRERDGLDPLACDIEIIRHLIQKSENNFEIQSEPSNSNLNNSSSDTRLLFQSKMFNNTLGDIGSKEYSTRYFYIQCWLYAFLSKDILERKDGINIVYNIIKDFLSSEDFDTLKSGKNSNIHNIRWCKDIQWCHHKMVKLGWIENVSYGNWKLTTLGRDIAKSTVK